MSLIKIKLRIQRDRAKMAAPVAAPLPAQEQAEWAPPTRHMQQLVGTNCACDCCPSVCECARASVCVWVCETFNEITIQNYSKTRHE